MDIDKKKQLMREYYNSFYKILLTLNYAGFCRFSLNSGQIIKKTFTGLVYNVCVLVVTNIGASYLLYVAVFNQKYLSLPETITITHLTIFANLMIIDITFCDKGKALELIENCIEIDSFFGPDETRFMRDVAHKMYLVWCLLIVIAQVTVVTYMYMVFEVSLAIHIVGSLYFGWIFFAYNDFCLFLFNVAFITLRARYLNVALINLTKFNPEYVPKQLIFNSMFWKEEYDSKVIFRNRDEDFIAGFRMLFKQLQRIVACYRFIIILGVLTIVLGSFVSLQALAMYLESPGLVLRAGAITFAIAVSWIFILILTLQTDMFYSQIEHTTLICACAQLKPSNSDQILKLTKSILHTLAARKARPTLYGMFYFNPRLMLNIAASTFVYITVQLQLVFPSAHDAEKYNNSTEPLASDDPSEFKMFLI